jgi:hypothetical protein
MAQKEKPNLQNTNASEQIGFHKGALTTLTKEREELLRILNIVEQLMKMHVNSLTELGGDLTKQDKKKPIEDMLK